MLGCVENRAVLLLLTLKLSDWFASSAGPALMLVAQFAMLCGPASSATVWLPPFANDGRSLTASTVTVKLRLKFTRPLFTVTVMTAMPLASAIGVKRRNPLAFGLV